jgi:DNA invertase Pin-like site-specific DNA recombinase
MNALDISRSSTAPRGAARDQPVRVVLIEDASRFARDLIAQELGIVVLVSRGVRVITANGDYLCDTSDPSRVMMRQIAGALIRPRP